MDIHDAHPIQFCHFVIQEFTHPADLSIETLREHDPECVGSEGFHTAFFRHRAQDGNAIAHALNKFWSDGGFDSHDILLVVIVSCTQDLVDNVPVIGQEDEALGGFVQSADRKETLLVTDEGDDVFRLFRIGGTDNADRLVERNVEGLGFGFEWFAIDADDIARIDSIARSRGFVIDGHTTSVDQPVCFPARADAGLADEFVQADGVVVVMVQTRSRVRSIDRPKIEERQVLGTPLITSTSQ